MSINFEGLTKEESIAVEWQTERMGGFYNSLMKTITMADNEHLDKIAMGFPEHVSAYRKYTKVSGWWQMVVMKACSLGIEIN